MQFNNDKKNLLKHHIRKKIYYIILKYPGIIYNELLRKGDFASGQLTYHLLTLENNNLIYKKKKSKKVHYYSTEFKDDLSDDLSKYLRDKNKSLIIKELLKEKKISFSKLSNLIEMNPSTFSWHCKILVKNEILMFEIVKKKKIFYLNPKFEQEFRNLLKKEKKSIVSHLVDSFIEFWDEDF
jgi:predicted transcriptional regulator